MMGEVESISEEIGSGKVRLFEDGRFGMMNHCYSACPGVGSICTKMIIRMVIKNKN